MAGRLLRLLPLLALLLLRCAVAGMFPATSFTLSNGLEVAVVENHRVPVVVQMLLYKAGNADAPPGKSGIAHLLEHLMFKGTPSVPAGEFSRRIARQGGEDNAYTTEDLTVFHQTVARQYLPEVMAMEADRMAHLSLTGAEVESERLVVLEERRRDVDDDPAGKLAEMTEASLFLAHPYRLPVLGWEGELRGLSRQDALDFYRRWYAPNNAVLVVAGDTSESEVRRLAEETYGKLPARRLPARERAREPTAYAPRRLLMRDAGVGQAAWQRSYLAPAHGDPPSLQPYAIDLLAEVLGGGPTSRLYRRLVVDQRVATDVAATYDSDLRDYGRFVIDATPPAGEGTDRVERAVDAVLVELLAKGITEPELKAAKAHLYASSVKARDGLMGPAEYLGTEMALGIPFAEAQAWPERIAAVGTGDIMAAARKLLHSQTSVTAELLPEAKR